MTKQGGKQEAQELELAPAEQPEQAALAPVAPTEIRSETGRLIQMALAADVDVEKLRALLALREQEDRRRAEQEFDRHFIAMQSEYVPVVKAKWGTQKAWKYAPLSAILLVMVPILAKHGFAYRWDETDNDEAQAKDTACYLSGHGFTRVAHIRLPYSDRNQMISSIQARGITSEYGRRYSFMNVTGCIVVDEMDHDGQLPEMDKAKIKKQIEVHAAFVPEGFRERFKGADTMEALTEVSELRQRCQAITKHPKLKDNKEEREKVVAWVRAAKTESALCDVEAHLESL